MVELVASPLNRKRGHEINQLDDIVIRNYALDTRGEIRVFFTEGFWLCDIFFAAIISIHISSFPKPDDPLTIPFEWSIIEVNGIDYCSRVSPPYRAQFRKRNRVVTDVLKKGYEIFPCSFVRNFTDLSVVSLCLRGWASKLNVSRSVKRFRGLSAYSFKPIHAQPFFPIVCSISPSNRLRKLICSGNWMI